jgi:RNA polymerase sigma factor (sigma-70 family)
MAAEERGSDFEPDPTTEQNFVQALRLQQDAAWMDLCYGSGRCWQRAYRLARIWCLSPQDAEDAAIEILVKVWRNLPTYDPTRAALVTWFYLVARSVMADFVKSSGFRQQACNCSIDTVSADLRSPNRNPEQAVIVQDEQTDLTILTSAKGALTEQERLILYYSFYEDLAPKEIAMILPEKTPVQISGIRFRALRKLRDFLVGRGYSVIPRYAGSPPTAGWCSSYHMAALFSIRRILSPVSVRRLSD